MSASKSTSAFAMIVDSIALTSAGLVFVCDPLVVMGGTEFPTCVSVQSMETIPSGSLSEITAEGGINHSLEIKALIGKNFTAFTEHYIKAMSRLFAIGGDAINDEKAVTFFAETFNSCYSAYDSHLNHQVVLHNFWVEPCCVVPGSMSRMFEATGGWHVLASPGGGEQ